MFIYIISRSLHICISAEDTNGKTAHVCVHTHTHIHSFKKSQPIWDANEGTPCTQKAIQTLVDMLDNSILNIHSQETWPVPGRITPTDEWGKEVSHARPDS